MTVYSGVYENSQLGEWYVDVDMSLGLNGHVRQVFESLMAFYPGMQVLLGEIVPAAKTLNSFFLVREFLGLLPGTCNNNQVKNVIGCWMQPVALPFTDTCTAMHAIRAFQFRTLEG